MDEVPVLSLMFRLLDVRACSPLRWRGLFVGLHDKSLQDLKGVKNASYHAVFQSQAQWEITDNRRDDNSMSVHVGVCVCVCVCV